MTLNTADSSDIKDAAALRRAMVDQLATNHEDAGRTMRPEIRRAMNTVPRHLFATDWPVEEAYQDTALVTKSRTREGGEESISSVSAPNIIAEMLGQAADALDGLDAADVLEIGSGGYNAALLRELVGPSGTVTTVDIDQDVTDRASACLSAAGYHDVRVICTDAEHRIEPGRYNLIIVTAGAWDIPPAWITQLTDDGVLVVPLRTFGTTRSWALQRTTTGLVSVSNRLCGFVPVRGDGEHDVRFVELAPGVNLRLDEDEPFDEGNVSTLLGTPRASSWAGLQLSPLTRLWELDIYLAARIRADKQQFALLVAEQPAITAGVVSPGWQYGTAAAYTDDGALVYRAAMRWTDRLLDLGAYAHDPDSDVAQAAADRMVGHMRDWVDAGQPAPTLHVLPAGTPDGDLPAGTVLDKRHTRLVLDFNDRGEES